MESQDAAATFFFKLWPQIEANKNKILASAALIIAVAAIGSFVYWRHEQNQIDAGVAMTQTLLTLPQQADAAQIADSYLNVATEYSGTPAGQRALLQAAAILFTEDKYPDAESYFRQFIDSHPDNQFVGLASLGLAKCLEAEGKLNDASGEYQHIINDLADPQAVIAAKFSLAQIDMQQHSYADAQRLFQDVAQSDPYSAQGTEAAQYLFELRSKVPAAPATPPMGAGAPFKLNR